MKKRILTLALVLMLLTSCLLPCATAFAEEVTPVNKNTPDFVVGATSLLGKLDVWQGVRKFKLEYLERIPGTPFATMKTIDLEAPLQFVLEGNKESYSVESIPIQLFLDALELDSFGVLQSYVKEFKFVEFVDGVPLFKAIYYETYYLNSKTADGCFENFYIDCNMSFKEFFAEERVLEYIEEKDDKTFNKTLELATEKDVEVFANSIYAAYPEQLGNYSLDEIYGYWSLVSIPKSYTFNGFFSEVGGGTFKPDGVVTFSTQQSLPANEIKILQSNYNMSGTYRFLNFLGKLFSADKDYVVWCYMLYVDGGDTELLITQNGSNKLESTQGALVNEADKLIDSIDWGALFTGPVVAGLLVTALVLVVGIIALKTFKKSKGRKK